MGKSLIPYIGKSVEKLQSEHDALIDEVGELEAGLTELLESEADDRTVDEYETALAHKKRRVQRLADRITAAKAKAERDAADKVEQRKRQQRAAARKLLPPLAALGVEWNRWLADGRKLLVRTKAADRAIPMHCRPKR
jgi:hypothetical protein